MYIYIGIMVMTTDNDWVRETVETECEIQVKDEAGDGWQEYRLQKGKHDHDQKETCNENKSQKTKIERKDKLKILKFIKGFLKNNRF